MQLRPLDGNWLAILKGLCLGGLCLGGLWLPGISYSDTQLSFQGYSGGLSNPSAYSLNWGEAHILYSNQLELDDTYVDGYNALIGFGILPGLEINGRIATDNLRDNLFETAGVRDLSLNVKWQLPRFIHDSVDIAIGVQDLGGEANFFDAEYAVASWALEPITLHMGLGKSDSDLGRLDGVFASVEYKVHDYLNLLAEYNGEDSQAFGVQLSNSLFTLPINWHVSLAGFNTSEAENPFFSVGLSLPLDNKLLRRNSTHLAHYIDQACYKESGAKANVLEFDDNFSHDRKTLHTSVIIYKLKQALVKLGFENIDIFSSKSTLYISIENNIFNHNEMDAIGVVMGLASMFHSKQLITTEITLTNFDIPVFVISMDNLQYRYFLYCDGPLDKKSYTIHRSNPHQKFFRRPLLGDYSFVPRMMLYPAINSTIATEFGVFDYSLALRANIQLPLWRGNVMEAVLDSEIDRTEDYEAGNVFGESRIRNGLRNLLWHQTVPLGHHLFVQLSAGKFRRDFLGVLGSGYWQRGAHRFNVKAAVFEESSIEDDKEIATGSYRYYWPQYQVATEITAGKFWAQDSGFKLETHHYFGDVVVSTFYANTEYELIGIGITLPLTPRRDSRPGRIQLRGSESWQYHISTRINSPANLLDIGIANEPVPSHNLERSYFNRDRLHEPYLISNSSSLRESFFTFGKSTIE